MFLHRTMFLLPVRPSSPLDTRDCQPRCQHTLTQLSFISHHPPRLPPVKLCAQGIYARSHNAPSRSTAFPLGSSTPPPSHAHAAKAPSPLRATAHTRLALPHRRRALRRSPHARGQHTHGAYARDARQTGCNGRPDDKNALATSPGSSAVVSVWCGEGRTHAVTLSGVFGGTHPPDSGPLLHVCFCRTCVSPRER